MENIIKKAIEGEYRPTMRFDGIFDSDGKWVGSAGQTTISFSEMIIDPLFWQALGKSCRWKDEWACPQCNKLNPELGFVGFHYHAMKFYELNLTSGWDSAINYLTNLIKS